MRTVIFVKLEVEGLHCWPAAREMFNEVSYLSDPHRHMFHVECKKEVTHSDRDVEFIMFKHDIKNHFGKYYKPELRLCDFGSMSCEMIAAELLEKFDCVSVTVSEDNENGAVVYR